MERGVRNEVRVMADKNLNGGVLFNEKEVVNTTW